MMDPRIRMMVTLLQAVRGMLRALDLSIVNVLELMKEDIQEEPPETPGPPPPDVVPPDPMDGECVHPPNARMPTPVMGHPGRYYCRMCGETLE
jgi:hypothetical protein